MNKHERAALARHQHDAGLANGRDTANIVLKRFPDGFDLPANLALRKIAIAALASSQAAALRFNNTLSTINTTIRTGATTFATDFVGALV